MLHSEGRRAIHRRLLLASMGAIVLVLGGLMLGHRHFSQRRIINHPQNLYPGLLTVGIETWPGYLALVVARDKGYYQDEGIKVQIKRYITLGGLSKDYMAGKMQARANLTLDAVNESLSGIDHKVILAIDYSSGSDAIAARGDIKRVRDFAGKRVGYEANTLEEFFLSWALRRSGMTLRDMISVQGNPQETGRMLELGQVDVAVTHEPFLSRVIRTGKAHTVYSSSDAPGLITDILTFRTDFVEAYPETIKAFLRAYFKALDFWKEHPDEACAILAREFGETQEDIRRQMQGITMLDLKDNRVAFSYAAGLQSLHGNMHKIADFVQIHRNDSRTQTLETDRLIEPRFIHGLLRDRNRS